MLRRCSLPTRSYVALLLVAGVAVAWLWPRPAPPGTLSLTPQDLCRRAFAGQLDQRVRVAFRIPLTPTDNPLAFEYRPGYPPALIDPILRVEFAKPPGPLPPHPVIVGTVSRIEPALRPSGPLGVVVISGARLAPESAP